MFSKILIAKRGEIGHRRIAGGPAIVAVAAALLTGAARPATQGRFAIECTGTAQFSNTMTGQLVARTYDVPRQVYVFDEVAERVQRALEPRQEFEDVCFRGGYIASVTFSPGMISVRSEDTGRMCDFNVSRITGEAEFFSHQDLPAGRYNQMEWRMTCSPTEIPVFDRSGNRF